MKYLVVLIIAVAIVSSMIGRMIAPEIHKMIQDLDVEGFETKNLDLFSKLLNHIDIVDISLRQDDDSNYWKPKMSKAIQIKGLRDGVLVSGDSGKSMPVTVQNMVYNRGGLRLCNGPCETNSQWSFEFSTANDLLYRLYPKGHMPVLEEAERKKQIFTPGSWFARIFRNRSNVVDRHWPVEH
jgi:hypothetical protein